MSYNIEIFLFIFIYFYFNLFENCNKTKMIEKYIYTNN